MNKVLFKKMLEAAKQGKDLKQSFTKEEIKQFMIQQAVTMAVRAITPFLGYIAIGALIIGVLLAVAIIIFQVFSGFWPNFTKAWGYLWGGTTSAVTDDNISILYYDLLQQGVDFDEIGSIGEHSFIEQGFFSNGLESIIDDPKLSEKVEEKLNKDNLRQQYSFQYWLDNVKEEDLKYVQINKSKLDYINSDESNKELSDIVVMVNKTDKDGNPIRETKEEAAARLLSQKLISFNSNKVGQEGYDELQQLNSNETIGLYLKRYLMAEEETFSIRNSKTFVGEGFQGGVYIEGIGEDGITPFDFSIVGGTINIIGMFQEDVNTYKVQTVNDKFVIQLELDKSVVDSYDILDGDNVSFENLVTTKKENFDFDVTDEMQSYAMPWQYAFAFHQHTLCPDVGYEIALMAHKYHNLHLQIKYTESGLVKVFNENGSQRFSETLRLPNLYVKEIATWYDTETYDYENDINSGWHGIANGHAKNYDAVQGMNINTPESEFIDKTAVLIETIEITYDHDLDCSSHGDSEDKIVTVKSWSVSEPSPKSKVETETYKCGNEHTHTRLVKQGYTDEEGNYHEPEYTEYSHSCNQIHETRVYTYEKLYIMEGTYEYQDNPTITISDTISKQEDVSMTGIEAMKELLLPNPEFDAQTNTVTNYEQTPKYYRANDLSIKEASDGTKYTKDVLNISTSAEAIIKSLYDMYNQVEYTYEGIAVEDIDGIISPEDSPNAYLSLENNVPIVVDLIQFFATNGIVDSSLVAGLGEANSFAVLAEWFISGEQVPITSSGNIANIITGFGKEILAPVSGVISKVDGTNYISIKTDKLGTVYLSNIELDANIVLGRTVAKGQKIGVTTGNVSYYRVDDAGQEITTPVQELKQLQTVYFSDYAWPVPDSANITSRFGTRTDPITGKTSRHNGVDIGAAQGSPIVAYMSGEIYKAAYDPDGYGYYIIIKHSDDCYTLYGHMSAFAIRSGTVEKNQVIGYVGSTGRSTGPHLHFEYRTGPNYSDGIEPLSKLSNYTTY